MQKHLTTKAVNPQSYVRSLWHNMCAVGFIIQGYVYSKVHSYVWLWWPIYK